VMMALGLIRIYCATISIIPVWRRWQLKPKSIMGRLKFNRNLKRVQPSPCGLRAKIKPKFPLRLGLHKLGFIAIEWQAILKIAASAHRLTDDFNHLLAMVVAIDHIQIVSFDCKHWT